MGGGGGASVTVHWLPPPPYPIPRFSPSLISLVVSVDVKHHVYLLTYFGLVGFGTLSVIIVRLLECLSQDFKKTMCLPAILQEDDDCVHQEWPVPRES